MAERAKCANCRLEDSADGMTEFEAGCLEWYMNSMTPGTIKAGVVVRLWPRLAGDAATLFLKAFNRIYATFARKEAEEFRDKAGK